jgi:hypothetical protein
MVSIAVPTAEGEGRRAATVELNGTVVEGVDHGGGAVAHAELGEDVADMGLTVASLTWSAAPISVLLAPRERSRSTSCSPSVSSSSLWARPADGRVPASAGEGPVPVRELGDQSRNSRVTTQTPQTDATVQGRL